MIIIIMIMIIVFNSISNSFHEQLKVGEKWKNKSKKMEQVEFSPCVVVVVVVYDVALVDSIHSFIVIIIIVISIYAEPENNTYIRM